MMPMCVPGTFVWDRECMHATTDQDLSGFQELLLLGVDL